MEENDRLLGWFLGPKAENASLLEEMLLLVLRDHCHWRRNYHPSDGILVSRQLGRELEAQYDRIYQSLIEMTAQLRRNFPFYSPRYMGHMLSDTHLPSILGYIAGMLYNPNNVTTEAAPVTVDMEIEACSALLEMLGYTPPPGTPQELTRQNIESYESRLRRPFAWAHLTFGGTTANLEALWVARTVKYAALAIWEVAGREELEVEVELPNTESIDIRRFAPKPSGGELPLGQLLLIRPDESIRLLAKYVEAYRNRHQVSLENANDRAGKLLWGSRGSEYGLGKGVGRLFQEFPPVIFASGTAHYSIGKVADILGIGRDAVELIDVNSDFRIDMPQLKEKLERALDQEPGRIPLAVIPTVGTTEEGAVDPVHDITDLREHFEKQRNASFWIHADAAWGGYFRSLFNFAPEDEARAVVSKVSRAIGVDFDRDASGWNQGFFRWLREAGLVGREKERELAEIEKGLGRSLSAGKTGEYLRGLKSFVSDHKKLREALDLDLNDRIYAVRDYVSDSFDLSHGEYDRKTEIRWGDREVSSALVALHRADSITVDPHKMGYVNYPCGMVAFKNDGVRHFILQKAPYITSAWQNVLVHRPPKHVEDTEAGPKVVVEALGPFIVEGSRPGASAASLWLTVKTIPPTMREGGSVVRASLLAARELYEWLVHWDEVLAANGKAKVTAESEKKLSDVLAAGKTGKYLRLLKRFISRHEELRRDPRLTPVTARKDPPGDCAEEGAREVVLELSRAIGIDLDPDLHVWNRSFFRWVREAKRMGQKAEYQFVPLPAHPPDTNIVIFTVRDPSRTTLGEMNELTAEVYGNFSIQAELGEREYSYSQPFFLTKTDLMEPKYTFDALRPALEKHFGGPAIEQVRGEYAQEGVTVLRATVMNPYLHLASRMSDQSMLKEFMLELSKAADRGIRELRGKRM